VLELAALPPRADLDAELHEMARHIEERLDEGPSSEAARVLDDASMLAARAGATRLVLAAEPADERHAAMAAGHGLHLQRELLQMRRPLPADAHSTVTVRSFRPGRDDEAWLAVNNRAFAWHPDQSGWTRSTLAAKVAEPWFDPDGFLLHEVDGELAAFCWTKVHTDTSPRLGEIFVIAVDPAFHGRGLGRELTLAGLDWLAARGLRTAMLYVEADNMPARTMYEDLGFTIHHAKRWWGLDLPVA
jgi:mycothiol synthase